MRQKQHDAVTCCNAVTLEIIRQPSKQQYPKQSGHSRGSDFLGRDYPKDSKGTRGKYAWAGRIGYKWDHKSSFWIADHPFLGGLWFRPMQLCNYQWQAYPYASPILASFGSRFSWGRGSIFMRFFCTWGVEGCGGSHWDPCSGNRLQPSHVLELEVLIELTISY